MKRTRRAWWAVVVGAACLFRSAALAAPPTVAEISPANNAADVDPALTTIVVRFDQPMSRAGHSIVGGGPNFPEVVRAGFTTDRRFEIVVRLKPSWDYELRLNGGRFQNFRSADGVPLESFVYRFRTRAAATTRSAEEVRQIQVKAVEQLRDAIDRRYSYKPDRQVDWDALFAAHRTKLESAPDAASFAREAGKMLAVCRDYHLWFSVDGRVIPSAVRESKPNLRFAAYRSRLSDVEQLGRDTLIAKLDGRITYVVVGSLNSGILTDEVLGKIDRALAAADPAAGVILDLRPNSGGDERLAQRIAARFVSAPVVYARHIMVGETEVRDRTLSPAVDGKPFGGKVAVLIGGTVMSSAESFVQMLKAAPRARLFGGVTAGSSGNPQPIDLGNGVTVFLPSWRCLLPDGTLLEGRGIQPDEAVSLGSDASRDDIIEAAVRWLK